jgi:quercetin dioxygenase-like cupin family protein
MTRSFHARRIARRSLSGMLGLTALIVLSTTAAFASAGSGQTASNLSVGVLDGPHQVNTDRIKFQSKDDVDVAMFTVTYAAAGFSGWHTHPGLLFVTVVSGSVTRSIGCSSWTYGPGTTFMESDEQPAGQVSNASSTDPAVLQVTQVYPHGSPRRAEASPPTC